LHATHATPLDPHCAFVVPGTHCPEGVQHPAHVPKRQLLDASLVVESLAASVASIAESVVALSSLPASSEGCPPPPLGATLPLVSMGGWVGAVLHAAKSVTKGKRAPTARARSLMLEA
jgi:hypothetical protein